MTTEDQAVDAALSLIAHNVNGTPDFTSDEDGIRVVAYFEVRPTSLGGQEYFFQNASELKRQYPDGFRILRVHKVHSYLDRDPATGKNYNSMQIELEILKKQAGVVVSAKKKREQSEADLHTESLTLDALQRGILDLLRAADPEIKPFEEMTYAKRKVIRSHLNTLQALMHL